MEAEFNFVPHSGPFARGIHVTVQAVAREPLTSHELTAGDVVLVRTGGDEFLSYPGYMARGCGVTAEATVWLCDHGVRLVGIDAWGWDRPLHLEAEEARARGEKGIFWAAHQCDRAYCQIERLAGLGALPLSGFELFAFPLKVVGGSAGPARVVAIEPG